MGNAVHEHATTDVNGDYSFSVAPGSYTVCETVPTGFTQSFPTAGADCTGHDGASGFGYAITLTSGETDSGNDFGNFRNATKSGTKFEDLDADGVRDAGEPGIAGVEIHLFGPTGWATRSTSTPPPTSTATTASRWRPAATRCAKPSPPGSLSPSPPQGPTAPATTGPAGSATPSP